MFTIADRDAVRARVLKLAEEDERVVAAAVVGSLALGPGDEHSDLDLTFAVAAGVPLEDVIEDWTERMDELGAVVLFDLPAGPTVYRVYLLPGCLQVDLSFTPEKEFAPAGPTWRLLFGRAGEPATRPKRPDRELVGYAARRALRAAVELLLAEAGGDAAHVRDRLEELVA